MDLAYQPAVDLPLIHCWSIASQSRHMQIKTYNPVNKKRPHLVIDMAASRYHATYLTLGLMTGLILWISVKESGWLLWRSPVFDQMPKNYRTITGKNS